MEPSFAPLRTPADLERALAEARRMLDGLETGGPAHARRFDALLKRIAEYRNTEPRRSGDLERISALDSHLKAFGRRWAGGGQSDQPHPWSPLLGGDVGPRRPTRG